MGREGAEWRVVHRSFLIVLSVVLAALATSCSVSSLSETPSASEPLEAAAGSEGVSAAGESTEPDAGGESQPFDARSDAEIKHDRRAAFETLRRDVYSVLLDAVPADERGLHHSLPQSVVADTTLDGALLRINTNAWLSVDVFATDGDRRADDPCASA